MSHRRSIDTSGTSYAQEAQDQSALSSTSADRWVKPSTTAKKGSLEIDDGHGFDWCRVRGDGAGGAGRDGSGGKIRTYDQAVNSRPLYH